MNEICFFFVLLLSSARCLRLMDPLDSEVINVKQAVKYLNSIPGRTWTAGSNNFGKYVTTQELEARTGSKRFDDIEYPIPSTADRNAERDTDEIDEHVFDFDDLPENYDARTMFPHCTTISSIKDQSQCGSCWAVSTAAAFSDRLCIHSKGLININISSSHILSCTGPHNIDGCHGGWEDEAWNFMKENGVVSGGDYGTFEGCQPYSIKPCGRNDQMPCEPVEEVMRPMCRQNKCTNEWHEPVGELYKVKTTLQMPCNYTHPCSEIDIRREIYRNGPVTSAFRLYRPLLFYKSGIFQMDVSKYPLPSGHVVRIIGWGVERGIPYWLIANSWGRHWGENGLFRMLRGKNLCRIESYISGGIPDIPSDMLD